MSHRSRDPFPRDTSEGLNQPPLRGDVDLWQTDPALREATARNGGDAMHLAAHGHALGQASIAEAARVANRVLPELRLFDRGGRRIDEVTFHPAYHDFLHLGLGAGYAAIPWEGQSGGHVTHAAMVYLHSQVEPATCCPMTMTYAATAAIAASPEIDTLWRGKLTARGYDPTIRPISEKTFATVGMAMTEKQGGSDIRQTTTRAEKTGDGWRLFGHKWFCSAPMSDGFLTLAQTAQGLSCFLVPRWLPRERNDVHIMRLKDKLGNRANASAEIEFHGALAGPVGEEGRGIATILSMVHHTRLDTAVAPAGIMRGAVSEALHWARHRTVFQRNLIDQPLMRAVLAELALDCEAALALGLRVARAFDGNTDADRAFARIAVALAKFVANKRCITVVAEAMEALGGMGYVEDTPLPLLYREAPLNGIWEGSGNVICLDILRTLAKEELAFGVLRNEIASARGANRTFDAACSEWLARWSRQVPEADARTYAECTASLLASAELIRHAPAAVSDGYCALRLDSRRSGLVGTATGMDHAAILARLT